MLLLVPRTVKVWAVEVPVVVASARHRAACAASSTLRVEGRGAPKYLRRGPDFAGDLLSLMVGCRGTGRFAHEQPKDSQGQRFVVGRARHKSRHEEQPSTREYRTLQWWHPAKTPSTWARGAGVRSARYDPGRKLMQPLASPRGHFFHAIL